ncbi:MAG: DUF975 family protein [Bacilli bacterium]|nr:DUF975 family protein [Bacilli bacterium]
MQRKVCKTKAKEVIKRNYWRCFLVCFIVTILTGGTLLVHLRNNSNVTVQETWPMNAIEGKTNSDIVNEFVHGVSESDTFFTQWDGFLGSLVNNVSRSGSFLFGILNAMNQFLFHDQIVAGIIIILGAFISILYWIFIAKVMEVGRIRFFLENEEYAKTRVSRIFFPFKIQKNFHIAMVMFQKNLYQFLWIFTIVGGPIKAYSYRLVPYLLAEDPTLKTQKVLALSTEMMKGHKWEAFCFDCSFLLWSIFGLFTLNLVNIFYTNLYVEASFAIFYKQIRETYLKEHTVSYFTSDLYLDNPENLDTYPEEKYFLKERLGHKFLKQFDYNQHYTLTSYVLLFFAFSMLGWIWEVCLTLFSDGVFVNRGTLFGPWLPIYGSGGVLILFLLQKIRNRPGLTFILTMVLCGIVEYGTALYLETFKHLKWWDYTGYFFNIHGRVCLEGLLFFGIGGISFIYVLAPFLNSFFRKWNSKLVKVLCVILVSLIACDFIYSSKHPNTGDGITSELVEKRNNS